jgi:hypothetical protein
MKKPEPMPPQAERAPATNKAAKPSTDDDAAIDRALEGEDGGRHPLEVDGYAEGGERAGKPVPVSDLGTARTFNQEGGGAGKGGVQEDKLDVQPAGAARDDALQVPGLGSGVWGLGVGDWG